MADAFFCDRCGKAYKFGDKKEIFSRGFCFAAGSGIKKLDLCSDCVNALRIFLNEKKEEDDD